MLKKDEVIKSIYPKYNSSLDFYIGANKNIGLPIIDRLSFVK